MCTCMWNRDEDMVKMGRAELSHVCHAYTQKSFTQYASQNHSDQ